MAEIQSKIIIFNEKQHNVPQKWKITKCESLIKCSISPWPVSSRGQYQPLNLIPYLSTPYLKYLHWVKYKLFTKGDWTKGVHDFVNKT